AHANPRTPRRLRHGLRGHRPHGHPAPAAAAAALAHAANRAQGTGDGVDSAPEHRGQMLAGPQCTSFYLTLPGLQVAVMGAAQYRPLQRAGLVGTVADRGAITVPATDLEKNDDDSFR